MTTATTKLKTDGKLQIVYGAVYVPNVPDSHGDFMTAEEIRKMAYKFLQKGDMGAVDVMHDNVRYGCFVVESFIVRAGDPDFPVEGTWVVAVHIPDKGLWQRVENGELNGFSMEALVYQEPSDVEINVHPILTGVTEVADGHVHEFEAWFDEEGNLIGGRTNEVAGSDGKLHIHVIKRAVQTEESSGHTHRFAFVEQMVHEVA